MREITTIRYEAFDGATFDDDSACIDYENDKLEQLAKESGVIFLGRDRDRIEPCEVEHCEYLYVPDSKAYDLISQIFELFELYSPFDAPQNVYNEDFEEDNPNICGWWVFDTDGEIWRNLRLEARTIEQMSIDLEKCLGVVQ